MCIRDRCSSYYEAKSDEDIVVAVCSRLNPENFKPRSDIDLLDEAIENGFDDPPFTYAELTEMVDSWPERPYFCLLYTSTCTATPCCTALGR